jgi:hypothetical protein
MKVERTIKFAWNGHARRSSSLLFTQREVTLYMWFSYFISKLCFKFIFSIKKTFFASRRKTIIPTEEDWFVKKHDKNIEYNFRILWIWIEEVTRDQNMRWCWIKMYLKKIKINVSNSKIETWNLILCMTW